jgi:hypothetical protein
VLTLTVEVLGFLPCIGALLAIGLASLGLGAVILTRFGTQAYVLSALPPAPPAPTAPPAPPAPPEAPSSPPPPPAPVETF